jgi:hypothetical protein
VLRKKNIDLSSVNYGTLEDVEENDDCILDVDILSSVKKVKTGKYICNTK